MLRYICILCFVSCNTALTYTCRDTCCFFKCLFILVCRSKGPTELMFHAVLYSTQNTLSMLFLFVEVKALLSLCSMLCYTRPKIHCLCLCRRGGSVFTDPSIHSPLFVIISCVCLCLKILISVINMSRTFKILVNNCRFLAFCRGKSPTWLMLVYSTQNIFSLFMSMSISKLS